MMVTYMCIIYNYSILFISTAVMITVMSSVQFICDFLIPLAGCCYDGIPSSNMSM